MAGEAQIFLATSLDGFIAGPDDDLSWLPGPSEDDSGERVDHGFGAFMATVGVILMGRRTYEIVRGFGGDWPYGETPMLIATTRPLGEPALPGVSAVSGTPQEMLARAHEIAGEKIVYVDGGVLIREFLDAGLIDELTITVIPVILGAGIPLFAGVAHRRELELVSARSYGLLQLRYRPAGSG